MGNLANGSFLKRTLGPEDSQKKKILLVPRGHLFCTVLFDSEWVSIPVIPVIRTFYTMFELEKRKRKEGKERYFYCLVSTVERKFKTIEGKMFFMGPQKLVCPNWVEEQKSLIRQIVGGLISK